MNILVPWSSDAAFCGHTVPSLLDVLLHPYHLVNSFLFVWFQLMKSFPRLSCNHAFIHQNIFFLVVCLLMNFTEVFLPNRLKNHKTSKHVYVGLPLYPFFLTECLSQSRLGNKIFVGE